MTAEQPLKLIAEDPADLTVLAACLQDALVPVSDMAWLKDEGRFALAVNRFMWERPAESAGGSGEVYHRTHALVRVDGVTAQSDEVKSKQAGEQQAAAIAYERLLERAEEEGPGALDPSDDGDEIQIVWDD